jgi:hypothetical protein
LVSVEGTGLDPFSNTPVDFTAHSDAGATFDMKPFNRVRVRDILFGRGVAAFELRQPDRWPSSIRVCASAEGVTGRPCAQVALQVDPTSWRGEGEAAQEPRDQRRPDAGVEEDLEFAEEVRKTFPQIKCACTRAMIRIRSGEQPHYPLGVMGGQPFLANHFGSQHGGDSSTSSVTSIFKFEAHFEYRIIGQRPNHVTERQWQLLMPYLCQEGQRMNGSVIAGKGGLFHGYYEGPYLDSQGREMPYEETRDWNRFMWDRHGYVSPGTSTEPAVEGFLKAHGPANTIHWLDAPGTFRSTWSDKSILPIKQHLYFHAFLHGTTGRKEDNCDCYFGLETGVIDESGTALPASVISPPVCEGPP